MPGQKYSKGTYLFKKHRHSDFLHWKVKYKLKDAIVGIQG